MKSALGLHAIVLLCSLPLLPMSHAQALSPGKGIDEVDVVTLTGTVDKVDLEKRKVTLKLEDGKTKTYKVDKSAQNLDQVRVGDHLTLDCTEELIVTVNKAGEAPGAASLGAVGVAPKGSKPGAVMVDTTAMSGTILAIDSAKRKVTFENPEGNKKTLKVKKGVDLSGLAAGDSVDAVLTESVAIDVTK
jgi:Cu/Ag efflux protein CusF